MRGSGTNVTKAIYRGQNTDEDFIVFIDDLEAYQKWKGDGNTAGDKSVPLTEFVGSFKILTSHGQGPQGILDGADDNLLQSEFPELKKPKDVDFVEAILSKPAKDLKIETTQNKERGGDRNDSKGTRGAH